MARAFISPDEPLPPRPLKLASAGIPDGEPLPPVRLHLLPDDEGVVTGMGSDPHLDPGELVTGGDPHVMEVAHAVSTLADALRRRGEAGLHATAGMSRLEATLRAYCVGYVAGRRAEDEDEQSKLVRRVGAKAAPEL